MSTIDASPTLDRRAFLRTTTAAAVTLGAVGTVPPVRAQSDPDFEAWFEDVENYDGVVDMTGQPTVTVAVGADGNGGGFAFEPAAVRVDPGTTVVWEWTGEGGGHNVVETADVFASDLVSQAGATFDHTFDAEGVSYYVCVPHEALGMKGAVVVGNVLVGRSSTSYPEPNYGDWFADVDNFDGTVDATGLDEVRIAVGADGNGGGFAFEPAAVRVDPGTTVVWEWTGDGGAHNVAATDGSFASDLLSDAGATYALEVDGDGVCTYTCEPHASMGMKGALVVGSGGREETKLTPLGMAATGGGGLLVGVPFLYALYLHYKELGSQADIAAAKQAARRAQHRR